MNRAQTLLAKKLTGYLAERMPTAEGLEVSGLAGVAFGASRESFTFDVTWEEGGEKKKRGMVLRRDLPTGLLDHVPREVEFKILKGLEGSGVPAPRAYYCESDPEILERPFLIMERMTGNVTQSFQKFGGANQDKRDKIGRQYVEVLARLHKLDWKERGYEFLGEPEGPLGYAEREVAKWEAIIEEVKQEPEPVLTEALIWMKANLPAADRTCLVHGDYKIDNIMCKGDEIVAVFDWEMATLGDPVDDLGWACMGYYAVEGLIQGLMERQAFIAAYEQASGHRVDPAALRFWQVFSNFKMAAITLTGAQRYVTGASRKNILGLLPLLMPKIRQDLVELLEF